MGDLCGFSNTCLGHVLDYEPGRAAFAAGSRSRIFIGVDFPKASAEIGGRDHGHMRNECPDDARSSKMDIMLQFGWLTDGG